MKIFLLKHGQDLSKMNLILFIILFSIMLRLNFSLYLVPSFNFSPLTAIALLSVCYFNNRVMVFLVPLLAVGINDCLLNKIFCGYWNVFYPGWYWQYCCYLLIIMMGYVIAKQLNISKLLIGSLGASVIFYVLSNFGVWSDGTLYAHNLPGFLACFIAAVPFFKNNVLNDLVYSLGLFLLAKHPFIPKIGSFISGIKFQLKIFKGRDSAVKV